MNAEELEKHVSDGEQLNEAVQEQFQKVEGLQGTIEALQQAVVGDADVKPLSDHQRERLEEFASLRRDHKGEVYGIFDKSALEAYDGSDTHEPRLNYMDPNQFFENEDGEEVPGHVLHDPETRFARFAQKYGPNVFGAIKVYGIVQPGVEGFMELGANLFRKAVSAIGKEVPVYFKVTAKGLDHYADMAKRIRTRLVELRPRLSKRDFPVHDVFDYGAYSRFFQVEGKPIEGFAAFDDAMWVQGSAMRHCVQASEGYADVVLKKLMEGLQQLQAVSLPDGQKMIDIRDSIERHWLQTWKEADLTPKHGQTPQSTLNDFPERKFTSLAPLLDNRWLVAHAPKADGGNDPSKIAKAIRHYGASLVQDKKTGGVAATSMNVPNVDDLLKLVEDVINTLSDVEGLALLGKKNDRFAKDFLNAMNVLNKQTVIYNDPKYLMFLSEYFKIVSSVIAAVQQPYVSMAWLYIRSALVVLSLVELSVMENPKDQVTVNRFFAKQKSEFGNPAMESYEATQATLAIAQWAAAK